MKPYIGNHISSYALFASIGLFCMMIVIYLRNKTMAFNEYLFFIAFMVLGAALGSKFLFIITQIPDIIAHFSIKYMIHKVITSGFVFYGGVFGAILGCIIFAKIRSYDAITLLNLVAPGYSVFHAFGRMGCFFAGCCYGKEADWGVALWNEPDVLRIPVQLIESAFLLLLTYYLLKMEKRDRNNLFESYLTSYAIFRFFIELLRGDSIRGIWGVFSTSQWVSLFILLLVFTHKIWKKSK